MVGVWIAPVRAAVMITFLFEFFGIVH
jgi:hypothetical protein